jgi:hypothetical protein
MEMLFDATIMSWVWHANPRRWDKAVVSSIVPSAVSLPFRMSRYTLADGNAVWCHHHVLGVACKSSHIRQSCGLLYCTLDCEQSIQNVTLHSSRWKCCLMPPSCPGCGMQILTDETKLWSHVLFPRLWAVLSECHVTLADGNAVWCHHHVLGEAYKSSQTRQSCGLVYCTLDWAVLSECHVTL